LHFSHNKEKGILFARAMFMLLLLLGSGNQSARAETDLRQFAQAHEPWHGDFKAILERRTLRVLVPYSRTLFFNDGGHQRGITAEVARDFERYLNRKYAKQLGRRPLTLFLIPTTRDRLLPALNEGLGDIAAGNLTITPSRLESADFVQPTGRSEVRELVVTGPDAPQLATLDDLSGKTIHVRPSTSYAESLAELNVRFTAAGRAPINIVALPDAIEDEDKLEMLNAGVLQLVVVDDWVARIWSVALPNIKVREDLVLRAHGKTGWAIRHGSPEMAAELNLFFEDMSRRWGSFDQRIARFHSQFQQIRNNTHAEEMRHFEMSLRLFEKYGEEYGFDPLMMAAQGYQESRLRQDARSRSGAIGVMQVMPATGRELRVGDITLLEPNIHAGTKYMGQLMANTFPDAEFDDFNRPLFAFASYNAGPNAIARLRRLAASRGLDPNQWFNHVEVVVAEKVGVQTTTYVRNICKYYVAYRLLLEAKQARKQLRIGALPAHAQ
jgi:membrane-bound lytic murein transglycosylase MltF